MTRTLWGVLPALTLALIVVNACGSNAPTNSPTGPTATAALSSITGTVTSRMSAARIRVTIIGTRLSAVADSRGRFAIANSPVGKARLQFAGPGINASLALPDLHAGKVLRVAIELNGQDANLRCAAEVDEPDDSNNDGAFATGDPGNMCDQGNQNDGRHGD
jgi:hypothetical protein